MTRVLPCFLIVLALITGCSKPQPSLQLLEQELQGKLPKYIKSSIVESHLAPMKQIAGSTLPDGSWQADVRVKLQPIETLYAPYTPESGEMLVLPTDTLVPEEIRKKVHALPSRLSGAFGNIYRADSKQTIEPLVFLVPIATPTSASESWHKLVAERRGDGWVISILDGNNLIDGVLKAKPRTECAKSGIIWGSTEQVQTVERLEQEKAAYDAKQEKIKRLTPEITEIRNGERALSEKYRAEVQAKQDTLAGEYQEKLAAIEKRKNQYFASMGPDQYAERDRLIATENQNWTTYVEQFEKQKTSIEKGFGEADLRAKNETEAAVKAACQAADLDASDFR